MQNIAIAGRIAKDAVSARTQGGQSVCNFTVPVDQGWGDRKQTNWFRCALWGKRGESLAPYLLKGVSVAVSGTFELGEYDGKPQLNINANEVTLLGSKSDRQGGGQQSSGSTSNGGGGGWNAPSGGSDFDDDLDSEVPF